MAAVTCCFSDMFRPRRRRRHRRNKQGIVISLLSDVHTTIEILPTLLLQILFVSLTQFIVFTSLTTMRINFCSIKDLGLVLLLAVIRFFRNTFNLDTNCLRLL